MPRETTYIVYPVGGRQQLIRVFYLELATSATYASRRLGHSFLSYPSSTAACEHIASCADTAATTATHRL